MCMYNNVFWLLSALPVISFPPLWRALSKSLSHIHVFLCPTGLWPRAESYPLEPGRLFYPAPLTSFLILVRSSDLRLFQKTLEWHLQESSHDTCKYDTPSQAAPQWCPGADTGLLWLSVSSLRDKAFWVYVVFLVLTSPWQSCLTLLCRMQLLLNECFWLYINLPLREPLYWAQFGLTIR